MKRKRLFLICFLIVAVVTLGLVFWTVYAENRAHYTPEYARVDLSSIISKEELSGEDYEILLLQTGLAGQGVEALYAEGRQVELYYLQERFFAEVEIECLRSNLIVQSERLVDDGTQVSVEMVGGRMERSLDLRDGDEEFLPVAQTGDILVSFSGHIFGWRSGHAAIVVDGERGLTVEALTLGSDSEVCSIERWQEYPCFALLRLKGASQEERGQIADYAEENLVGIPYRLLAFEGKMGGRGEQNGIVWHEVVSEREEIAPEEPLAGTHCAHLVWQAYSRFGYDLDSDGGLIVTPRDLYESDLLEVVQVYGLQPKSDRE